MQRHYLADRKCQREVTKLGHVEYDIDLPISMGGSAASGAAVLKSASTELCTSAVAVFSYSTYWPRE